ncbi:histidine protein methyltransferase 1 homolog [Strongylocentrotus purpuratus]|uniref:protein-histidine N-methyltransferase n=1 Tax=Strongylocentrotus purpuratus TaxID=7668 RepID=A0A7M7P6F9_STRPU|nr:histidine protein methyltransferase 1 homolog [Strongylocentrotus purpuratus]
MGDFTFGFEIFEDDSNIDTSSNVKDHRGPDDITLRPAKEIYIPYETRNEERRVVCVSCGDVNLCYLHPQDVEGMIEEKSDIKEAITTHSDLLPSVYEGGLKVWECSLDLVQYLQDLDPISFSGQTILELGCGAGLPGIYTLMKGATVHFQDYNEEVLELLTIPNVQLNTIPEVYKEKCHFLAGDWSLVQDLLMQEGTGIFSLVLLFLISCMCITCSRYDVILTSETIYSLDSQPRLYNIIRSLLKPNGKVFLAAKTHYFGVGGGTRQFEDFVREKGEFEIESIKVISQGVRREILEMRFIQPENKGAKT